MTNEELQQVIAQADFRLDKMKDDIHDLFDENKQLKEKIDKAIEYNKNILKERWYGGNEKKYAKTNLEILGDKE